MPALRAELIAVHGHRLRVGPWRSSPDIGQIALVGDGRPVTRGAVVQAIHHLRRNGFRRVLTGAVPAQDTGPFLEAGMHVRERLHLLRHDLERDTDAPRWATRRARRSDWDAVLELDAMAFDAFWRLDRAALEESIMATPIARFRVVGPNGANRRIGGSEVAGYAVFGWSGDRGYLQRLGVHPDHWGQGLGELLVRDGLAWLRRRGASAAYVNTQERNQRGLELYQRLGFTLEPHGLTVLELADAPA